MSWRVARVHDRRIGIMDRVKLESAIGQIVATFKDVEEPVNVLRELSNVSMLLCETEKLR